MKSEEAKREARRVAHAAKAASESLGISNEQQRNAALARMAEELREHIPQIMEANGEDLYGAREQKIKESLIDRLMLDAGRIESMATALEDLKALPDPLGIIQDERTLESGILLKRISVPLGVVAMVYEARPNVTADAAGICLKSGNAAVLRGGSLASRSNTVIAGLLHRAAVEAGMPQGCIGLIESCDRVAADELMQLHGIIDVLIPRGGAGLINHCVNHSKVPVIETGTGNCHVYVHSSASYDQARNLVLNAKCRRYGVCNAAETLLVDQAIADEFIPLILSDLNDRGVLLHTDAASSALASIRGIPAILASEEDWKTEYLGPEIAVRVVAGIDEAISHINRYGTKHSEAIVASDKEACARFTHRVDAAAVYANASTAFTDGAEFGLGAEIGISTQKLHVRGPFALQALTSYKYVLCGTGQVRA